MIRTVVISILTILLIGFGVWGYGERQDKQALLIHAENNYQRSFHNLTYQLDVLNEKIGSSLAMNSQKSISPTLADVWRITSEARSELGQLPLSIVPFNKTEEFLANIGSFSYRTAVRNLDNEPLTEEEYNYLLNLYEKSDEIKAELRNVQYQVLNNDLRWMDIELAVATNEEPMDHAIVDGFNAVEKRVEGYDEKIFDGVNTIGFQQQTENYAHIKGEEVNKDQALEIGKKFAKMDQVSNELVTESSDGAKFPFYTINLDDAQGNQVSAEVTKKGGHPIWFMNHREIGEQKLSLNEAENQALQFLNEFDYKGMKATDSVQYDTIGLFTFATVIDDVRIYPEVLKIQVALDNGQIIGFTAADYLKGKKDREMKQPKISLQEAKKSLNQKIDWSDGNLAIIENELNEEVLCYEFLGVFKQDTYQVFINADTGMEEKVEKKQNAETQYKSEL